MIRSFIKAHYPAIIVTFVVACLAFLPYLTFFYRVPDFQGIMPVLNGDTLYYQARIHEVLDGHPDINHPYFAELKSVSYPQAVGAEWFVAHVAQRTGFSLPGLQLIFDVFASISIFILLYALFFLFGARAWLSAVLPLVFFIAMGGAFKPVHPQVTFPLLLVFLISWTRLVLSDTKKWIYTIICGTILGLLFLSYFYHWSFIVVLLGLHGIYLLATKQWKMVGHYGALSLIGILIGIPYVKVVLHSSATPFYEETAVRVGLYFSHWPETLPRLAIACVWFIFFTVVVWRLRLRQEKKAILIAVLLLGNILYPNHQMISGMMIQHANHWAWMPLFIYGLATHYSIVSLLRQDKHTRETALLAALTLVLFLFPVYRFAQYTVRPMYAQLFETPQDTLQYYGPALAWIEEQSAQKPIVVLGDQRFLAYVPVYTSANVYYSDYAFNLPGSDKEVIERALLARIFEPSFFEHPTFGMNVDTRIIWTQPAQAERNTHRLHEALGIPYEKKYDLEKEVEKVKAVYEELRQTGWSIELLKKYDLDYIVWEEQAHPEWQLSTYKQLHKVASVGPFSIYEFADKQ